MDIKKLMTGLDAYDPARMEKSASTDKAARLRRARGETSEDSRGDTIKFSDDARLRTDAHAAASSAPDIRREKVEAIKAQIAAGEYKIDTQKIASKVVQDDLDFFGL